MREETKKQAERGELIIVGVHDWGEYDERQNQVVIACGDLSICIQELHNVSTLSTNCLEIQFWLNGKMIDSCEVKPDWDRLSEKLFQTRMSRETPKDWALVEKKIGLRTFDRSSGKVTIIRNKRLCEMEREYEGQDYYDVETK